MRPGVPGPVLRCALVLGSNSQFETSAFGHRRTSRADAKSTHARKLLYACLGKLDRACREGRDGADESGSRADEQGNEQKFRICVAAPDSPHVLAASCWSEFVQRGTQFASWGTHGSMKQSRNSSVTPWSFRLWLSEYSSSIAEYGKNCARSERN